jgi:hypothetical protein
MEHKPMQLRIWNVAGDPYNSEELAANFEKVDQHDGRRGSESLGPDRHYAKTYGKREMEELYGELDELLEHLESGQITLAKDKAQEIRDKVYGDLH